MTRRLGPALLALLVALTGVSVCARGVQACSALHGAKPDCCAGANLAVSDCCCPAKGSQSAAFLPAGDLSKAAGFNPLQATVTMALSPDFSLTEVAFASPPPARAIAPPDTPISLHTSLLL